MSQGNNGYGNQGGRDSGRGYDNRNGNGNGNGNGGKKDDGPYVPTVAIAAGRDDLPRAAAVANMIMGLGIYKVTAEWIRTVQPEDPERLDLRDTAAKARRQELLYADMLVLLTTDGPGDVHLIEFGDYLKLGRPIIWSLEKGGANLYDTRTEVLTCAQDEQIPSRLVDARKLTQWKKKGEWETKKAHNIRDERGGGDGYYESNGR